MVAKGYKRGPQFGETIIELERFSRAMTSINTEINALQQRSSAISAELEDVARTAKAIAAKSAAEQDRSHGAITRILAACKETTDGVEQVHTFFSDFRRPSFLTQY